MSARRQTMFRAMMPNGSGGGIPTTNLVLDLNPEFDVYTNYSGTTPVSSDGDSVAYWGDQSTYTYSGGAMSARQLDSAERPLYYSSDANRNNKPYLLFDSNDRWFVMEPYSLAYQMPSMTMYFICEPATSGQNSNGWMISKTDSYFWNDGFTFIQKDNEDLNMTVADDGYDSNEFTDTRPTSGTPAIYSYSFKGSSTVGDRRNDSRIKLNGSAITSKQSGTTDSLDTSGWFSSNKMLICGGRDTGGSEVTYMAWVGKVFRVLIYDTYHSATEQEDIMTELASIYNL